MISRKSAMLLAEVFKVSYTSFGVTNNIFLDELYDLLYEYNFESYFLNMIKSMRTNTSSREIKEFFMKIHTGETLTACTLNWSWEDRKKLGQRYLKDLSELIISKHDTYIGQIFRKPINGDKLKSQLEIDGYIYKDGTLYFSGSSVINEQEEQSYLLNLMKQVKLSDIKTIEHHVALAEEHYLNSKYDDSIANSRKFLEAILQQTANEISILKYSKELNRTIFDSPRDVRDFLEKEKLIEKKEKEALSKIYGLLSNTGSHPYIADKDQARLMWNYVLTTCQFVLLRYNGYKTS